MQPSDHREATDLVLLVVGDLEVLKDYFFEWPPVSQIVVDFFEQAPIVPGKDQQIRNLVRHAADLLWPFGLQNLWPVFTVFRVLILVSVSHWLLLSDVHASVKNQPIIVGCTLHVGPIAA